MTSKKSLTRIVALIVPLLFLTWVFFTGCEKEVEKVVEKTVHDTVTVNDTTVVTVRDTIMVQIISVDDVYATPDSIAQGGTIQLTADVTTKPEAGQLTYYWQAAAGELSASSGDTVSWKAPADPGAYMIQVHVTDGTYIGIGTVNVGVGMYAPTTTPYYVGDMTCNNCHSAAHSSWEGTGHADAWASLMTSDHAGPSCFPCHSVGYEPDPNTGNSGFDEAPIAKFENVQCENCHGAGSDHIANPGSVVLEVTLDAQNCTKCHNGTHHPYKSQWESSAHNFDPAVAAHGAGQRSTCQPCHSGAGFVEAFPTATYTSHAITWNDSTHYGITCQVCHDSHSAENVGQLRTTDDITLVSGEVVSGHGAGQLCIQCHHARHSGEEQVPEGDAHFGPHGSTQGDVVYGTTGYEEVNPTLDWVSSGHGR